MFAGHDNLNSYIYIGTIEDSSPLPIHRRGSSDPMFSRDEDEGTLKFKGYHIKF